LLDRYPVQLRGLNTVKYAGYEEVYIISNLSLDKLYTKEQEESPAIYKALLRRIGRVIRFDDVGVKHIEKDMYKTGVQETMEIETEELPFDENLDY